MKNIEFRCQSFTATTYVKGNRLPELPPLAEPFLVLPGKGQVLTIPCNDDIPLAFGVRDRLIGGTQVSLEAAVKEEFSAKLHATITQFALNTNEIEIYMGPCLTFSHTHVERKLIEELMERGYRASCKRTDGVEFLDLPLLVLTQCRKQGIPMTNIHISDYDTFENPGILYSRLYGDNENNYTIIKSN